MRFPTISAICFTIFFLPDVVNGAGAIVMVRDAWIREAPPNASTLAGYMILENHSTKNQSLISASTSAFAKAMIHRTEHKGDMTHMTHQKQVTIPANGKVVFAPSGYHLMLMEPKRSLRKGDEVTINLTFADKSKLNVIFKVRKTSPLKGGDRMKCGGRKCGGM